MTNKKECVVNSALMDAFLWQIKAQPDVKVRYSEKKHRQSSSISQYCIIS